MAAVVELAATARRGVGSHAEGMSALRGARRVRCAGWPRDRGVGASGPHSGAARRGPWGSDEPVCVIGRGVGCSEDTYAFVSFLRRLGRAYLDEGRRRGARRRRGRRAAALETSTRSETRARAFALAARVLGRRAAAVGRP